MTRDLDGTFIMVLEYAENGSLKDCLKKSRSLSNLTWKRKLEILRRQKYTSASDIYGFGIITYEIIAELPPYYDVAHEELLAIEICQGLRPNFNNIKVPQSILHLIDRCLDANPYNRPTANELCDLLHNLVDDVSDENSLIYKQIEEAEKVDKIDNGLLKIPNLDKKEEKLLPLTECFDCIIPSKQLTIHPKAIYASRLLKFNNLPEPKNGDNILV